MSLLRITEIFYSLQGEADTVGIPTVFIRLTGCPLRCTYCDTAYAFQGGKTKKIDDVLNEVERYRTRFVTVTGGEPLAQKNCLLLLKRLCDKNYRVSLETSGALDLKGVDPRVIKIMDLKTPSSNELERNRFSNLEFLSLQDQLKFVIGDRNDYNWANEIIQKYQLLERCQLLFSPSYQKLPATELANWILEDQLPVRFQIQLHKFLWGDTPGK